MFGLDLTYLAIAIIAWNKKDPAKIARSHVYG